MNALIKKPVYDTLPVDAETTDGYHLNQNLLTTSSPTFAGLTITNWISHGSTYSDSICLGFQAGLNASGTYGIYVGTYAGYDSAANFQTAVGENALRQATGIGGTAIGPYALYANTGIESVGVGWDSGNGNKGTYSTFCGSRNGYTSEFPPGEINSFVSNIGTYVTGIGQSNQFGCTRARAIALGSFCTAMNLDVGTWAAVGSGTGTLDPARRYRISAVVDSIESELSEHTILGTGSLGAQIDHTNIPLYVGPGTCTSRKIYRRKTTDGLWYLVGTINDNSTTTYTDTQGNTTYGTLVAGPANTMALGHYAFTVGTNEAAIGSSNYPITTWYWGSKYHRTTGNAGLPFYQYSMGGFGTNQAGGTHYIGGGQNTGSAVGGPVIFRVAMPGTAGTTAGTYQDKLEIRSTGIEPTADGRSLRVWSNFEDFVTSVASPGIYTRTVSGTAAASTVTATGLVNTRIGIYRIGTGTTNTGYGAITANINSFILGGGVYTIEGELYVDTLSDGTDTYTLYFGFGDTLPGDQANGVYFKYSDAGATPNWMMNTAKASVRTSTSSATAVVAATWTKLKIIVATDGSSATYYINGTSVGTVSTNMPTASCGPIFFIEKSAGTTGRNAYVDWIYNHMALTTSR